MKSLLVKQERPEAAFSYEIVWKDSFSELGAEVKKLQLPSKKACIVTDSNVAELYLERVRQELEPLFEKVTVFLFPAGEENKNLLTVQQLYTHLIERKI